MSTIALLKVSTRIIERVLMVIKLMNAHLASASQAPPKPASTVPFRRNSDFVDRGDLLSRVDERCSQTAGRAALVGLGGVGKSQLAIEYGYRVRERSPQTWIFWVHAGTQARFEEGYRKIAEVARRYGWDDPTVNILRLVRSWLCDESNGQWLMIVDNADNFGVLLALHDEPQMHAANSLDRPTESLSEFLPQLANGSALITSRSRDADEERLRAARGSLELKRKPEGKEEGRRGSEKGLFGLQRARCHRGS